MWKKKEKLKERGWTGGDGAKMRIGQNGKNRKWKEEIWEQRDEVRRESKKTYVKIWIKKK